MQAYDTHDDSTDATTYHDNNEKITSLNQRFGVRAACVTRTKVL